MSLITDSLEALYSVQDVYLTAKQYSDGLSPEAFATPRLARLFRKSGTKFRINYCSTVISAVSDRLEISSVACGSPAGNAVIEEVWEDNLLGIEAGNVHEAALTYGETYVIFWTDDDEKIRLYHHDPFSVRVFYDPANKRIKTHAIKTWDEKKRKRVDLYFADRVERYVSVKEVTETTPTRDIDFTHYLDEDQDESDWLITHEWGEVPVFHFRTNYPDATPEHIEAYGPQSILNKLVVSQMSAVDFDLFPQRYALQDLSGAFSDDPSAQDFEPESTEPAADLGNDTTTNSLHSGPGTVQVFKGMSSVGEFSTGDPKNYTDPIAFYVEQLGVVTGTPTHLLEKGQAPQSGAARRAQMETLTAKVGKRQRNFAATWKEMFNFILRISGIDDRVQIDWAPIYKAGDDEDFWKAAEYRLKIGVPREVILREAGYTDLEMSQWNPEPIVADIPEVEEEVDALELEDAEL